ncbi:MAG: hypothetical protein NC320_12250 [Clostridium sp.]|nr:hypothetical protein [Clostridium sp.]
MYGTDICFSMAACSANAPCTISGENTGLHCVVKFDTNLTDDELYEKIVQLGFNAVPIRNYYHEKNLPDLHKPVFFY